MKKKIIKTYKISGKIFGCDSGHGSEALVAISKNDEVAGIIYVHYAYFNNAIQALPMAIDRRVMLFGEIKKEGGRIAFGIITDNREFKEYGVDSINVTLPLFE